MQAFACRLAVLLLIAATAPAMAAETAVTPATGSAAASAASAAIVTADSPAAREALAVAERFHAALQADRPAEALALLDPALQVYEAGHAETSRDEYAASHLPADIAYLQQAEVSLQSRRAVAAPDGRSAWVLSQTRTAVVRDGKRSERAGLETLLLHETAQGWRIVHIHWSSRALGGG